MKKAWSVLIILFSFGFLMAKGPKFPKGVSSALDKAVKGELVKDDLNLTFVRDLYYPAQGGDIYFVQFVKADLPAMEEGKPAHLFLRLYDKKGKKVEDLYAPIDKISDYYSFPITFAPGKYRIAVLIGTNDLKKFSIKVKEVDGENLLNLRKLSTTPIIFLKGMEKLPEPIKEFRCYHGEFPLGLYMIKPYLYEKLPAGTSPAVFFFILGAQAQKPANTYNIVVSYEIKKDGKTVTKFPKQQLTYSVVYQPIPLKSHGAPLEPGLYKLHIKIQDMNARAEIDKKVNFEIVK